MMVYNHRTPQVRRPRGGAYAAPWSPDQRRVQIILPDINQRIKTFFFTILTIVALFMLRRWSGDHTAALNGGAVALLI
jgi:hypothetical protein